MYRPKPGVKIEQRADAIYLSYYRVKHNKKLLYAKGRVDVGDMAGMQQHIEETINAARERWPRRRM